MRRGSAGVVVPLLMAAGCGQVTESAATDADQAMTLGGCQGDSRPGEGPGVEVLMASSKHYEIDLRRSSVPQEAVRHGTVDWTPTIIPFEDTGVTGASTSQTIRIHDTMFQGLVWARDNQARTLIGMTPTDDGSLVTYALVVPGGDGVPFFVGSCQYDMLTAPGRELLGPSYATEVVRRATTVEAKSAPTEEEPVVLNPETAPEETLDRLTLIRIRLVPPTSWLGQPYMLGTRIPQGWNDAVSLEGLVDAGIGAYVGTAPLDVWILDRFGTVKKPVARVASLPAAEVLAAFEKDGEATISWFADDISDVIDGNPVVRVAVS